MTSEPGAGGADPYAAARANIRDSVKWLVAAFASMAAALVAGMPLAGIGALEPVSGRFVLAAGALLTAAGAIGYGLVVALRLLRSEGLFLSDLEEQADAEIGRASGPERAEMIWLRNLIETRARDVLPSNYPSLGALRVAIKQAEEYLKRALEGHDANEVDEGKVTLAALTSARTRLLWFALYQRAEKRLADSVPKLLLLGVVALSALLAFVWAANPPTRDDRPIVASIAFDGPLRVICLPGEVDGKLGQGSANGVSDAADVAPAQPGSR